MWKFTSTFHESFCKISSSRTTYLHRTIFPHTLWSSDVHSHLKRNADASTTKDMHQLTPLRCVSLIVHANATATFKIHTPARITPTQSHLALNDVCKLNTMCSCIFRNSVWPTDHLLPDHSAPFATLIPASNCQLPPIIHMWPAICARPWVMMLCIRAVAHNGFCHATLWSRWRPLASMGFV